MSGRDPFQIVGTTIAGKYRVDRVIGEGGCGIVYAGFHLGVSAPIAIKALKPLSGDLDIERRVTELFLREARVLFGLTHPNIVRLYDASALTTQLFNVPYVVLEYIDGPTLDEEIQRRAREGRPFSRSELLAVFEPVLEAVAFAHENNIAHRDLKPSNVMLVRTQNGVSAKVVDFGIARRLGEQRQTLGVSGFTPRYAAPEQWDSTMGAAGAESDVFSLGLILCEACTLRPALGAAGAAGLVAAVMDPSRRIGIANDRPDLGQELDRVIERATRVARTERFRNGRELLGAFRAAITGTAIAMPSTSAPPETGSISTSAPPRSPYSPSGAPTAPIARSSKASSLDDLPAEATARANPGAIPPPPQLPQLPSGGYAFPAPSAPAAAPPMHPSPRANAPLIVAILGLLVALLGIGAVVVFLVVGRGGNGNGNGNEKSSDKHASTTKPTSGEKSKKAAAASELTDDPASGDDDDTTESKPAKKKSKKAAAAGGGSVEISNVLGAGPSYTDEQVYEVVEKGLDDMNECYQKLLAKRPGIQGKLTVMIDVDAKGNVNDPMCAQDGISDGAFRACVNARASKWKFPKPKDDLAGFMVTLEFNP